MAHKPSKTATAAAKPDASPRAPRPANGAKPPEPKAEILPAMNDELFDELCDRIANGSSLLRLEKEDGFPARSTMWKFITSTQERRAAYEQAREDRSDYHDDLIGGIVAKLNAGKIDPASAKVMIDAIKWQASKENKKVYGDSNRVDLTVSHGPLSDLPDEELDRRILQFMKEHDLARLTAPEKA
jgi:hypothetical protein